MFNETNTKKYIQYSSYLQRLLSYISEDNDDYVNENLMYEVLYAIRICKKYGFDSVLSLLEAYKTTKKGTVQGGKIYGDLLELRDANYTFGKSTVGNRTATCIKGFGLLLIWFIGVLALGYIITTGGYSAIMQAILWFFTLMAVFLYGAYLLSLGLNSDCDTAIKSSEVQRDLRSRTMDSEISKKGIKDYNVFSRGTLGYVNALVSVEFEYEEYILGVEK